MALVDGQPKVDKFHNRHSLINQDILRFDIPVDDPVGMHTGQPKNCLEEDAFYLLLFESTSVSLVELEGVDSHILKDQFGLFLILLEIQDRYDVGMFEPPEQLGFSQGYFWMCFHNLDGTLLSWGDCYGLENCAEVPIAYRILYLIFFHYAYIIKGKTKQTFQLLYFVVSSQHLGWSRWTLDLHIWGFSSDEVKNLKNERMFHKKGIKNKITFSLSQ